MPKKGDKKQRTPLGDLSGPQGFAAMAEAFFTSMEVTNYAEATIRNRYVYLRYFVAWCDERDITSPSEVTRAVLERYQSDRAMLEVIYCTGMRRMELSGLKLYDIDAERGTIMIRRGKGRKDRMVPISERALAWIEKYVAQVRPELVLDPDDGTLFLTADGQGFGLTRITQLVRNYVIAAKIGKTGSCHMFRHTMATLMLENGADVRVIQQLLGHAKLETTQIYTQVSIRMLKRVHEQTHPAAKLKRGSNQVKEGQRP